MHWNCWLIYLSKEHHLNNNQAEGIETGQISPARYTDMIYTILKSLPCSNSHMANLGCLQLELLKRKVDQLRKVAWWVSCSLK